MKYCLFDGGDVVGPFTAKQLLLRPGFGAHSLVCPEEHSVEGDYWKEAHFYEEFGLTASLSPEESPAEAVSSAVSAELLEEMGQAVRELDSFHMEDKAPAAGLPRPSAPQADKSESKQTPPPPPVPEPAAKTESPQLDDAPAAIKTPGQTPVQDTHISSILIRASREMKTEERKGQKDWAEAESSVRASGHASKTDTEKIKVSSQAVEKAPRPDPAPAEGLSALDKEPSKAVPAATGEAEVVSRSVVGPSNPIEEYFNTIKSGDLGRILGIPDPNENSDLSLARALESQFEKTDPGTGKLMDGDDPFDEFLPTSKPEPLDEFFQMDELTPDKKTEENLKRSLPDLQNAEALPLAGQARVDFSGEQTAQEPEKGIEELVMPPQEDDPEDKTVQTILEGKLKVDTLRQEIAEPIKEVPAQQDAAPHPPAPLASSGEEQRHSAGRIRFLFLLLGVVLLLAGAGLNLSRGESAPAPGAQAKTSDISSVLPAGTAVTSDESVPDARTAVNAAPIVETTDPLLLAQEIVQNYQLDNGRGTIEQYLNRLYSKQLQDGYAAAWSAESLHRDSYVVKYRLAKTRQEPIVYIFQADTAKKKLTGALNNITLDLVGKIS